MPYRWLVAIAVLIFSWLAVIIAFRDTAGTLIATWAGSSTFSHGFLIFPISLYLLVRTGRQQAGRLLPSPNLWVLFLFAPAAGAWLVGHLAGVALIQQFAVVMILQLLVWMVMGSQVAAIVLFPILFLLFAVPVGESLVRPLQDFTAFFIVKALELSAVPVLWEGDFITVSSARWEVAAECSAIRYVIPAVPIAALFSYFTYKRWTRGLIFVLTSVLVLMLANGARAYGVVILTHLGDRSRFAAVLAESVHRMWGHLFYGWLMFGVVMGLLFWLGTKWREPSGPPLSTDLPTEPTRNHSPRRIVVAGVLGVAIAAAAPITAGILSSQTGRPLVLQPLPPAVAAPWKSLPSYRGNWSPRFREADIELKTSYAVGDSTREVHLYVAYYSEQKQGAELVYYANSVVGDASWTKVGESRRSGRLDGDEETFQETFMRSSDGMKRLVWSVYWVGGEFTASPYAAKLFQVKARLLRTSPVSAVIALGTDYFDDPSEAASLMQDFLAHTNLRASLEDGH